MPAPEYFESLMLIFFSLNWYWSIARMWTTRASDGKSISANVLIAMGYVAAIIAALSIADEYFQAHEELQRSKGDLASRIEALADRVDGVVPPA